jgi:hypothetical protein
MLAFVLLASKIYTTISLHQGGDNLATGLTKSYEHDKRIRNPTHNLLPAISGYIVRKLVWRKTRSSVTISISEAGSSGTIFVSFHARRLAALASLASHHRCGGFL